MKVTIRAFATPLVLGMTMVFLSGSASWSCDQGGCDNRPDPAAQEPQRVACDNGSCNNRPEQVQQEPVRTACEEGSCNNRRDGTMPVEEVKPLRTASCMTSDC